MTALTWPGECPVCGVGFDAAPRDCPRCSTPHHPDCWDYVPGCAVFACTEAALTVGGRPDEWPLPYRLILMRSRVRTVGANLIQGAVLGMTLLAPVTFGLMIVPPLAVVGMLVQVLSYLALVLGALALPASAFLSWRIRREGGDELLARARSDGDRRLRDAVEARAGLLVRAPPWEAAVKVGTAYAFLIGLLFTVAVAVAGAYEGNPWILLASPLLGLLMGGVGAVTTTLFTAYPLFWIAGRLAGSERVLLNRLEAGVPRLDKGPGGAP